RARSGLSVDPDPTLAGDDPSPEEIVPDEIGGDDRAFRLRPEGGGNTSSIYRNDSQFDDGGLDDFIRQLKRDTRTRETLSTPRETKESLGEEPVFEEADEEELGFLLPGAGGAAGGAEGFEQPFLLAAFAPSLVTERGEKRDVVISLAAAEDEPGFFCNYLGWTVAWSSMCVDDANADQEDNLEDDVAADLEQELRQSEDDEPSDAGRAERPRSSSSSQAGRERVERRLSEEDAAEAIEDAGDAVLAPVTSSLEKLRDFIRNRGSEGGASSPEERRPSLRARSPAAEDAALDRPPTPERRPKQRLDITVVDKGETFEFNRTPRPAFKPTPDEPVIEKANLEPSQPPEVIERSDPPPEPRLRPEDLLAELKGPGTGANQQTAADEGRDSRALALASTTQALEIEAASKVPTPSTDLSPDRANDMAARTPAAAPETPAPSAVSNLTPDPDPEVVVPIPPAETTAMVIRFEPETPGLPSGLGPELAAVLEEARAQGWKVHIIGEASTNHLARRRATDVGAALVQLGATVEILEYDHDAISNADQVRLVLRPASPDPLVRSKEPSVIVK
ncbi:MAG: hypothetical protein AAGC99_22040, partial [Pseudomonadota bacterium]